MKVDWGVDEKDITIIPTEGRVLSDQFIDFETGYLVAFEQECSDISNPRTYCFLFDIQHRVQVSPTERLEEMETYRSVFVDPDSQLKQVTWRSVDVKTGLEYRHQELSSGPNDRLLSSSRQVAFSKHKRTELIERFKQRQAEKKEDEKFWTDEYPLLNWEQRRAFWHQYFRSAIRQQAPKGDLFWIFDPASFEEWHGIEPRIGEYLVSAIRNFVPENEQEAVLNRFEGFV